MAQHCHLMGKHGDRENNQLLDRVARSQSLDSLTGPHWTLHREGRYMKGWICLSQRGQWPGTLALILLVWFGHGCSPLSSPTSTAKLREFRGKVIDVSIEKRTVTIQHEDIPGLMPAMTMTFRTGEAVDLADFQVGDTVHGKLAVQGGDHVIVHLQRSERGTRKP